MVIKQGRYVRMEAYGALLPLPIQQGIRGDVYVSILIILLRYQQRRPKSGGILAIYKGN